MKVSRGDAHDRFSFYQRQDFNIAECCQSLINQRPFGDHSFYIFAHARTLGLDEKVKLYSSGQYITLADVPEKTIIWQPRLTKPKCEPNSMLFKAYPGSDNIKVIWILPPKEYWDQFKKGNMTENETIFISIYDYEHSKDRLEAKEEDDLPDEAIDRIYKEICDAARKEGNGRAKTV
jgi:hypothetical protein